MRLLCLPKVILLAAALSAVCFATRSSAGTLCDPWLVKMVSVQGNVQVRRAGQAQWQQARLDDLYCPGDRIQVGQRSRADVAFANQPILRLDQNSTVTLGGIKEQRTALVELLAGALYFFSRVSRNLEIQTPFVNAGVEGTEGFVLVDATRTLISIFEGTVLASNPVGMLTLVSGQTAIAEQGRAPTLTVTIRPDDAVRWALYYLPTLYFRAQDFPAGPDWRGMVRKSIEAYSRGDFEAAFDSIQAVPATLSEPRFFAYRAALLLAVGRVDEASQDIERALSLNPNDSDALSLQSIIAVVQNDKEKALALAQRGVTADPQSASARIALSYAQQANFDLDGALNSLQQATQLEPENALAWARLAEVWLSFGDLDEALKAAERAVALDPLSRTQTVLGFAFLTGVNTEEAKKAFERATVLDQADPLPRLGLGLAKIREGDLQEGRREIEIAVSLDPQNALIRSYLGKAYFEEKREKQAADQYEMSKSFDPKDPTPYFYDAILKQTANRPVEALQDMEKAIELNDNRAVYRSRLLLDSDLAARSAALSRIYSDLGFQQLALVEGWKSVNTDPTNFSAHRFLADSYSVLPRHEIARVSELLQSQLLQPLNMTPIQPHLAESNLFLISAGGPTALSFNEFNPLFNRNGVTFQTTGLAGENKTYAGEGVLSGIYNKAAFSLGGFHFQTDGWRRNADQRDAIANAFLQLELSPKTSVQAEYRYRNNNRGDIRLRFFPDDVVPFQTNTEERQTARIGIRHGFSPDSQLLGSFIYQDADFGVREDRIPSPIFTFFDIKRPLTAMNGEIQHLLRSQYFSLTSGGGYAKVDGFEDAVVGTTFPPPFNVIPQERLGKNLRHGNVYAYASLHLWKDVSFTLGGSGDFTHGDDLEIEKKNQFNPKFGLTWNPFEGTTVRAAVFRAVKRTLVTNQTLEPTQVAGFNQFFDDNNGTDGWRLGGAVDQKIMRDMYSGIELSKRDLESPFVQTDVLGNSRLGEQDLREVQFRGYFLWAPHPWVSLSSEFFYESFKSQALTAQPRDLETFRVPVGLSFFHPTGISSSVKATYVNQDGEFVRLNRTRETGSDSFWTVDAMINYRLVKRYGFITLGVTNLFNKGFKFFDRDVNNPKVHPKRFLFTRVTLAFP